MIDWFASTELPQIFLPPIGIRNAQSNSKEDKRMAKGKETSNKSTGKKGARRQYNGGGTYYKRCDGYYMVQAPSRTDPTTGKSIRQGRIFKSSTEATAWLDEKRAEQPLQRSGNRTSITVKQMGERFVTTIKASKLSPTTLRGYKKDFEVHIVPVIGDIQIRELTPEDIDRVIAAMEKKKSSSGTIRKVMAVLSSMLNTAKKRKLVTENVVDLCEKPRHIPTYVEVVPDERQIGILLQAAQKTQVGLAVMLAIGTGLRLGEVLGLKWVDMDLDEKILNVTQSIVAVSGKVLEKEPKTKASLRSVVLPDMVVERLLSHREGQANQKAKATDYEDHHWVFATGNGKPMSTRNFHRSYYRFLSDAKLPIIHFKAFRHMQATLMDGFHAPIKTTQARMGHSDIKTTLTYYTHETKSIQRPIARQVDEYMKNAMESVKKKGEEKTALSAEDKPDPT